MGYTIPNKKSASFELPVLGLGTWQMGGGRYPRDSRRDDEADVGAIKAAIESGITLIDTAEIYANGRAEELIREAVQDHPPREKLFITSKVSTEHLDFDEVIRACNHSLKRLGMARLDLYLIHGIRVRHMDHAPDFDLRETMRAMDYLVENGLTRFIGVSNFTVPYLEEAQSFTKYKIVNNQIHYSLAARAYEENGTLEYCAKHQILVSAYRPLFKGDKKFMRAATLLQIAKKYNKTAAQVALNWVMNKPNVIALFKTSNPDHLREDLGAIGWKLSQEDEEFLDINFPRAETLNLP